MPTKEVPPSILYWDACVFIDSIQRTPGRIDVIDEIKQLAQNKKVIIVTSSIVMAEVIKMPTIDDESLEDELRRVREYLENPWITRRTPDNAICEKAGELRRLFSLKLPDAIHLATALKFEVRELQTYDDHLLKHNGKLSYAIKKQNMKICHPNNLDNQLKLFDRL